MYYDALICCITCSSSVPVIHVTLTCGRAYFVTAVSRKDMRGKRRNGKRRGELPGFVVLVNTLRHEWCTYRHTPEYVRRPNAGFAQTGLWSRPIDSFWDTSRDCSCDLPCDTLGLFFIALLLL